MRRLLVFSFGLSGAAALVYETVWSRELGLVLGTSVHAAAVVLACTMGGMALGAGLAARIAPRLRDPLVAHVGLEALLALLALATIPALRAIPLLHAAIGGDVVGLSPEWFVHRIAACAVVLVPPCAVMGATLPFACGGAALRWGGAGPPVGRMYAANLVGAATGVAVTAFFLVEALGLRGSILCGCAASVTAAGLAGAVARRVPRDAAVPARGDSARDGGHGSATPRPVGRRAALAAVGVSGFVALASEVLWTRVLTMYVGNGVHSFGLMVLVFLLGLGLGSALAERALRRWEARPLLVASLAASAILSLAALGLVLLPVPVERPPGWVSDAQVDAALALVARGGVALAIMGLQPIAFGAVLPLAARASAPGRDEVGATVGRLAAANATGNVAGALATGFVLLPALGLARVPLVLAAVAAAGAGLLARGGSRPTRALAAAAVVAVALTAWSVPQDLFRRVYEGQFGTIVAYEEGVSDTVMVVDHGGELVFGDGSSHPDRWLFFSDRRGTAGTSSVRGNFLYAHVPMLLHPDPRKALVICFGSGNTAAAAAAHPGVHVDVVDVSPEVYAVAPAFTTNDRVVERENVRLHVEDGRSWLLGTAGPWDVVTLEPPFLDTAGVVNLYTRDFYELAARRLAPGGLLAQWFPLHSLSPGECRLALRTFVESFPHVSAWEVPMMGRREWILVGSAVPQRIDLARLERAWAHPGLAASLARADVHEPLDLAALRLFDGHALAAAIGQGPVMTDDRSRVDFSTFRWKLLREIGMARQDETDALIHDMASLRRPPEVVGAGPGQIAELGARIAAAAARSREARDRSAGP